MLKTAIFFHLLVTVTFAAINEPGCGVSKVTGLYDGGAKPYIVGGTDVQKGQYPWMVSMTYMGLYHTCGTTIIDDRWLLTAAHCFQPSIKPSMYLLRAGRLHVSQYEPNAENYNVEKIILHEKYNAALITDDIALIKTKKPINFKNLYIGRVCLPETNPYDIDKKIGRITGWGDTKNLTQENMAKIMQQADIEIQKKSGFIFPNKCLKYYGSKFNDDLQVCVKGETTAACVGDSGGPLHVKNDDGAYVQVGVTSYVSSSGCLHEVPNVYTRVSAYLDWIKAKIAENS